MRIIFQPLYCSLGTFSKAYDDKTKGGNEQFHQPSSKSYVNNDIESGRYCYKSHVTVGDSNSIHGTFVRSVTGR